MCPKCQTFYLLCYVKLCYFMLSYDVLGFSPQGKPDEEVHHQGYVTDQLLHCHIKDGHLS